MSKTDLFDITVYISIYCKNVKKNYLYIIFRLCVIYLA